MIFGRRRKAVKNEDEQFIDVEETVEELDDQAAEVDEVEEGEPLDKWDALDISRDWREDGPFDISEVDLDADDVERLDFGCLVLTPFEGMQMQLQVDQRSNRVQAALVMAGSSAIEIALFAAPANTRIASDVRRELAEAAQKSGGKFEFVEGPFGTEVRRMVPVTDGKGNKAMHISRTWLAEGPKWLLRGVVMGEAAQASGTDGVSELLYEFFSNTVVRRDAQPRAPRDLIPMTLPTSVDEAGEGETSA